MDYRPRRKASFPWVETTMTLEGPDARLRAVTSAKDKGGRFLWRLVRDVLVYAARRIPEISDDIVNGDRAIRWGFAWEHGPFETWDALGVKEMAARLEREGVALPPLVTQVLQQGSGAFYRREDARLLYFDCTTAAYRPVPDRSGVIVLADQKRAGKAAGSTPDATIVAPGDGVARGGVSRRGGRRSPGGEQPRLQPSEAGRRGPLCWDAGRGCGDLSGRGAGAG